jgi:hyaluronoglucosaminidase
MIFIMQNRMMRFGGTAVATGIALAALGIQGAAPASVVRLPAATAYVANARSDTVTPIDIATGARGPAITVHGGPAQIAVTPGGTTAYVASQNHGLVTPIDTLTDVPGRAIKVGTDSEYVAVTPDGRTVYAASAGPGTVTPIDTATGSLGTPIPVTPGPDFIAFTPDGKTAYVSAFTGRPPGGLTGIVTPVRLPSGRPGTPVILGRLTAATDIGITPDGSMAYVVALEKGGRMPGIVVPINTLTGTAGRAIHVGNEPLSVAFAP